jgi:hypothetical protein
MEENTEAVECEFCGRPIELPTKYVSAYNDDLEFCSPGCLETHDEMETDRRWQRLCENAQK